MINAVVDLLGISEADVKRVRYVMNYDMVMVETWNRRRLLLSGMEVATGVRDRGHEPFYALSTVRIVKGRTGDKAVLYVYVHANVDSNGWTPSLASRGESMLKAWHTATGWVHGLARSSMAWLGGGRSTIARALHAVWRCVLPGERTPNDDAERRGSRKQGRD